MISCPYIVTDRGVTVYYKSKPVSIDIGEPEYMAVLDVLRRASQPDTCDTELEAHLETKLSRLAKRIADYDIGGLTIIDDLVYFNKRPLNGLLANRLLKMHEENFDLLPLQNFLQRLDRNPSYRAVQGLYDFLDASEMAITPDGCFLAYKAIRADWRDIHSGKFDNSIGRTVSIPRNQVDENPDVTCSSGLHVCSFSYLPSFAHDNGHVVMVKIDPADVVAVPRDYNNAKMRVCSYQVVAEVTDWYKDNQDLLTSRSVWNDEEPEDEYEDEEEEDEWEDRDVWEAA
jgi:hypothetical protein